jgi:hypothetical protein
LEIAREHGFSNAFCRHGPEAYGPRCLPRLADRIHPARALSVAVAGGARRATPAHPGWCSASRHGA